MVHTRMRTLKVSFTIQGKRPSKKKLHHAFKSLCPSFLSLFPPLEKRNFRGKNITYKKLFFRIRAIDALGLEHGPSRGLFLESPENFSGPKSQLSHCNPLVLKR